VFLLLYKINQPEHNILINIKNANRASAILIFRLNFSLIKIVFVKSVFQTL